MPKQRNKWCDRCGLPGHWRDYPTDDGEWVCVGCWTELNEEADEDREGL